MKPTLIVLVLTFASSAFADTWVDGYYRSDGSYVQGHYRSSPNSNSYDNYSTKGNINPYNGQQGYKNTDPVYQAPQVKQYDYTNIIKTDQ